MFEIFSGPWHHFKDRNSASFILYYFRTNIFDSSEVSGKIGDEIQQPNRSTTDGIIANTDTTVTNSN